MKALLLDGSHLGDPLTQRAAKGSAAALRARGYEVQSLALGEADVAACRGCFGCWTKTPGTCTTDDVARDIAARWIASDLVAFVTPVTFGGYSSELKKALDRMICLISPKFGRVDGEVHHQRRYDRYPRLVAVGTLPSPDTEAEATFKTLVRRNAINMHSHGHAAAVVSGEVSSVEVEAVIGRSWSERRSMPR